MLRLSCTLKQLLMVLCFSQILPFLSGDTIPIEERHTNEVAKQLGQWTP